jgi:hypothetical protein
MQVTNIFPNHGQVGTGVKITGSGFSKNDLEVYFNVSRAINVTFLSSTTLRATVPQGATNGEIHVSCNNNEATSPGIFTVDDAAALRITPVPQSELSDAEAAIIAAWNNLFQPGEYNLPNFVKTRGYEPINLGNMSGGSIPESNIDICYVPGDQYSPIGASDASLTLNSLQVRGLSSMTNGGTPTFSGSDQVTFTVNLGQLTTTGNYNISQPCCIPTIFGCSSCPGANNSNSLTYTVDSSTMQFTATYSTNPLSITVTGLIFNFSGAVHVNLGGDNNQWSWLDYLSGYIVTENQIKSSLVNTIQGVLEGSQMVAQIQNLIDQELQSPLASGKYAQLH